MFKKSISVLLILLSVHFAFAQCFSVPVYCSPSFSNVAGYSIGIQNVTLGSTINNTTVATGNAPNYFDYTSMSVAAAAGTTVYGSVRNGSGNSTQIRIFVDWNQDGVYGTTAPELAWSSNNTAVNVIISDSIVVPTGQTPGVYRIRVTGDLGGSAINPCNLGYGEVEDYTLVVTTATSDGLAMNHTSPNYFISGNNTIGFSIVNLSSSTMTSVNIGYQLDGNSAVTQSLTGLSVAAGGVYNATFSTSLSIPTIGNYSLKVWLNNVNGAGTQTPVNDTICRTFTVYCSAALSGVYTINPSGTGTTNFKSFGAADSAMISCGINGPVVFNVATTTYTEQISIPAITGASATNTITFDGGNGGASSHIISYPTTASAPYVVRFNGCSFVTFRNLTIRSTGTTDAWVAHFLDGANNRFNNCIIEITGTGATATGSNLSGVVVNGSVSSLTASSATANNHLVDSCTINAGYYNVYCSTSNGANTLSFNSNSLNSAYYYGMYFNSSCAAKIRNNTIDVRTTNVNNEGIHLINCNASGTNFHEISRNKIVNAGSYGLYFQTSSGSGSAYGQIYNNMIGGGFRNTNGYYGINDNSSRWQIWHNSINMDLNATGGTSAAIYLGGGNFHDIQNNHIVITATNSVNTFPVFNSTAGNISTLDNNNYFNNSGTAIISNGGVISTVYNYKTSFSNNGGGVGSISTNPFYISALNLHTTIPCNNGVNLGITTDYDGNARGTSPDIGADEVTTSSTNDIGIYKINTPTFPLVAGTQNINVTIRNYGSNTITSASLKYQVNGATPISVSWSGSLAACDTANYTFTSTYNFTSGSYIIKAYTSNPNGVSDANTLNDTVQVSLCPSFSGSYTIDPAGSGITNFTSFTNAINALNCGGVYGPVTFVVATGTYNEQVQIQAIPGISATRTVTFTSATGIPGDVVLSNSATAANNYTLRLNGANYINLKNFTIVASNTNYGVALSLTNNASVDSFTNMFFNGVTVTNNTTNHSVIYCPTGSSNFLYFNGCTINNGAYGSYFQSNGSTGSTENLTFNNCNFINQYSYGMYNYQLNGLILTNNKITTNSALTSYRGMYNYWIYINTLFNRPIVTGNKISGAIGGVGMYNQYFGVNSGTTGKRPIISNNMIDIGTGTNSAYGLQVVLDYGSDYVHNTITTGSTLTTNASAAAYFQSNSGAVDSVTRNIFVGTNGAPAIRCDAIGSFNPCNFNDLFTTGANLGYLNATAYTTLALWRTGSGRDANSISVNPNFVSSTDLHINSTTNLLSVPVHVLVPTDYDNVLRCANVTDIGADHHPGVNDIGVSRVLYPVNGVAGAGSRDIIVVLRNFGTNTITSANVSYKDATTTKTIAWTGSLGLCDSAVVTFTGANQYNFTAAWNLKYFTDAPNGVTDGDKTNDTIQAAGCTGLAGVYTINPSGSGSSNFTNFTAALAAMSTCGVGGPVVFNVAAGTFNEQVSINNINGASAINTVTFDGGNGNSATRILTFNSTAAAPHTLRFNNCNYVTVRNITLRSTSTTTAWVANFLNGTNNRINNCIVDINGSLSSTSSTLIPVVVNGNATGATTASTISHNNTIDSCTIIGGYYTISVSINNSANILNVNNNTINDGYQYGFYALNPFSLRLRGNAFNMINSRTNPSTSNIAIYMQSLNNVNSDYFEVNGNRVINSGQMGIYMNSCSNNGTAFNRLYNNMIGGGIRYPSGGYGIYLTSCTRNQIYHNSVNLDIATTSGTAAALYITSGSVNDVRNNTLAVTNPTALLTYCCYLSNSTVVSNIDNNNYYNLSSLTNLLNIGNVNITSTNYRTAGGGSASINVNPYFVSATNLHTTMACNNGAGLGVTTDFDGEARNSTPDIGADEVISVPSNDIGVMKINSPLIPFASGTQTINVTIRNYGSNTITSANVNYRANGASAVTQAWTGSLAPCDTANFSFTTTYSFPVGSNNLIVYTSSPNGVTDANANNDSAQWTVCTGMSGAYTINPSGSGATNFTTFSAAAAALGCGGVYGPVTFTVAATTYNEQINIPFITGASSINTITFEGFNSATRVISYTTTAALPYVLRFNNCDFVTFKNFTIRGTGTTTTWVTHFLDGSNNRVTNCNIDFTGTGITSASTVFVPVVVNGNTTNIGTTTTVANNHSVDSNTISYGYYSVYCTMITDANKLSIIGNTFNSPYQYGFFSQNGSFSPRITGNTYNMRIAGPTNSQGIFIQSCSNQGSNYIDISSNKILNSGQYGIYLNSCQNSGSAFNQIINNMIGGGFRNVTTTSGIFLQNVNRTQVYHNSINFDVTTTGGINAALYFNGGNTNDVRNNNLSISNTTAFNAYSLFLSATGVLTNLDFNNYYNRSATSLVSIAGTVYTPTNFKSAFPAGGGLNSINFDPYYLSATNLHTTTPCNNGVNLGIAKDIDGETRATTPDIGADEIVTVPNNDIGVMKINSPSFPMIAGSQTINVTLRNFGNNIDTSAIVNYVVNGGTVVSQTWTGSLAPCDTVNFSFSVPYTFATGTSVLRVYTTSPNGSTDAVTLNDTLQVILCTALNGVYTINPAGTGSSNYTTFNNAINALICGGVYGPVVFNVAAATYTEQLNIPIIPGTSNANTVTFDGGNGNNATRIITFPGTALIPSTVYLNTTSFINFRNLTIQTTGTAQGWAVNLFNSKNCKINNCFIEVMAPGNTSTSTAFMGIVMSGGNTTGSYTTTSAVCDNNTIDSSTIKGGYYGVYSSINNGLFTNYVLRNTIINQYQGGAYFSNAQTVKCKFNTINLTSTNNINSDAITLTSASASGALFNEVSYNKINGAGRYGIYLPASAGSASGFGQVYNNMLGGGFLNTAAYGIYITSTRWNVWHNTVNLDAPLTTTSACMYLAGGSTNDIRNNVFAVTKSANANAVCLYTSSAANITTLDYNNYFNLLGVNLLNIAGSLKTVANFKTAYSTGGGLNSVNSNPMFISNSNLHILGGCNNGANLGLTDDIDGNSRGTTPDMGADEIPVYTLDAMVTSIRTPAGLIVTGGSPYVVKILVRNNGTTTITSLDASYSINGVATTQTFTSGSGLPAAGLVSCDTIQLTFTTQAVFSAGGPGFFKAYTGNVNSSADLFHDNDTLSNLFCTPFSGNFTINAQALPSGTNFISFNSALSAVYSCGVAGPVVFRVVSGSGPYNEQLTFTGPIPGATATNTVAFKGGLTKETISFNAGVAASQHTIRLSGVKHVIIDSLTINALNPTNGIGVHITNIADSNYVQNCILNITGTSASNTSGISISSTGSPTGTGNNGNKNIIQNNFINGGYYGISAEGTSSATYCRFNQIIGNTIVNAYQYGMWVQYQDTIKLNSNSVSMSNLITTNIGMYLQYMDRFELKKNKVNNVGQYGIYLVSYLNYQNNAPTSRSYIVNNMVGGNFYSTSGYGIFLGQYSFNLDIQHNSVSVMNAGSIYAFYMTQTAAGQFGSLDVRNNSFVTYNGTGYAVYFYYATTTTSPFIFLNYNNCWNSNTTVAQVVVSQSGYNTNGWIGAFGYNTNSKWLDPLYLNPTSNLHSLGANLNDVGINLATVTEDFDGDSRPISPSTVVDIGADEYNRPANDAGVVAIVSPSAPMLPGLQDVVVLIKNFGTNTLTSANVFYKVGVNGTVKSTSWTGSLATNATATVTFSSPNQHDFLGIQVDTVISWTSLPNNLNDDYNANDTLSSPVCKSLSGPYTINPAGSGSTNFVSFATAFQALTTCGVSGPVTLSVAPGVYTGRLVLTTIPNASNVNRVTFDGIDSSVCKITDIVGGTTAQPAVITFNGADYITFKNFNIHATGVTIGVGVLMQNGADYNRIERCNIRVSETSTSGNCFGFGVCGNSYTTAGANGNYNRFENNAIIGGYVGASLYGTSTAQYDNGNAILNCNFTNMYQYGIYSYNEYLDSVIGNTIRFRANAVTSCIGMYFYYNNGMRVERNIVYNAGQYGIYSYFTNYTGAGVGTRSAINNNILITNTSYASPITFWSYYPYNTEIYFNTAYCGGNSSTSSYAANISYAANGTDVKNNIFYNNNTTSAFTLNTVAGTFNTFDYNNLYTASATNFASWLGVNILDLPALKAVNPLFHQNSISTIPNFVSTTTLSEDMHLTSTVPAQYGDKTVPVFVDVDNESRCTFSPTIGADESKYNSGNPTAGFTTPDSIFVNDNVVFLNNNLVTLPLGHRWYVDGILVSTSHNLSYTFPSTGTYSVKLFTYACVGTDSITKTIVVYNPTQKPVVDFVADKYVVETYQQIQLTDLSKNGPTYWNWTFIPSNGVNFNNGTTNNSKNPVISFSDPGLYEVCLWDSNAVGRSLQVCKTAYIRVNATNQLCIFPFDTKVASGVLYDDGGPNGNYSANGTCNFLIDPCASSVNLVFSSFNLAGSAYLRIYNGKNNLAPALHTGLGFTGTALPGGALGITASSGKMYIEFAKGATVAAGFAATWTSIASSSPPPSGSLDAPDTAYDCGAYTTFSYVPNSIQFDKDGANYKWWFDYANSSSFPDVEAKGLFAQEWSYGATGTYIIRCDIEGCGGTETLYDTIEIVHPTTGPIVDFMASLLVATPADVIELTDLSKIDPVWWQWTITGPGNVTPVVGNANSKNYSIQFTTPGIYSITLKDSNCVASNTLTKTAYITIIDYCIPVVSVINADFSIEQFKLGRADTIINNSVYGLDYTNISPAVGSTTYRDNTNKFTTYLINNVTIANTPVVALLGIGESIDFTVKRQSNFNNANFKIWIDYNQDGIFQTTELAASSGITSGINYSGQISVPMGAKLGFTRLRIGTNFDSLSNTPCGINAFGDFNDFRVKITPDITPPTIYVNGNVDTVFVEVGRMFVDPGYTVTGATTITHTGIAFNTIITTYPSLAVHTITATDASNNTTIRDIFVRATRDITKPVITRTGADTVYSEVLVAYSDLGATATDFYFGSLTASIVTNNGVNINKPGTYTVTYNVTDASGNIANTVIRVVIVRDTQKPVITISGSNPLFVNVHSTFNPPTATVSDNYNTGLTYVITGGPVNTNVLGTYTLFYNAVDSSGNVAVTQTLTVIVRDITPPRLTLLPADTVIIDCITLTTVPEPGYVVQDNYYTAAQITVSKIGNVNLNVVGTYSVRYYAADPSGNIDSSNVRVYKVVDREAPVISLVGAYTMNWPRWKPFVDPGTTIFDKCNPGATVIPDMANLNIQLDGLYYITYNCTDASGNKATPIRRYVNIYTPTGINSKGASDLFAVYPNPNNGLVNVELNIEEATTATIMVFDANGKVVYQGNNVNPINNKIQLDLSNNAAGIYFIKLVTDKYSISKSFSIQK